MNKKINKELSEEFTKEMLSDVLSELSDSVAGTDDKNIISSSCFFRDDSAISLKLSAEGHLIIKNDDTQITLYPKETEKIYSVMKNIFEKRRINE